MRTTMTIKHKTGKLIILDEGPIFDTILGKKTISFGKNSYGQGENTLTDHRSQNRIDNRRLQGKHLACKKCTGCGKGNPCQII